MDIHETAFECSPDMIVCVDREGRILQVNRQAEALLGFSREELIGKNVDILVPERHRGAHAGFQARYGEKPAIRTMADGTGLSARRKDGAELPVGIMLSPAPGPTGPMVIAVLRDERAKREAEDRARELHERLNLSSEAAGLGYWRYEQAGDRFWCDSQFSRLLGGAPSDFPDFASVRARIHPHDRETLIRRAGDLERNGRYDAEFRVALPDGTIRWLADMGRCTGEADRSRRVCAGVVFDITARKASAERQAGLMGELLKSQDEIKVLRGLLPICAHCKRIRDEQGRWEPFESFIHRHSEADFSHGVCPECIRSHYPDLRGPIGS